MSLKNIFKAASITFRKYRRVLLPIVFAMGVMLFGAYILGSMFISSGVGVILTLFLLFPCLVGLKRVAMNCVTRKDTQLKDFYFGFSFFGLSCRIEMMTIVSTLLYFLLGVAASVMVFSLVMSIYVYINNPEIINLLMSNQMEEAINAMSQLKIITESVDLYTVFSFFIGGLFAIGFGLNKQYLCYISFDSPSAIDLNKKYAMTFLKTNKKKYFLFNLIFLVVITALFSGCYYLQNALLSASIDTLVSICVVSFIFILVLTFILMYYMLASYHSYNHYIKNDILKAKEEIMKMIEDMKNNINK